MMHYGGKNPPIFCLAGPDKKKTAGDVREVFRWLVLFIISYVVSIAEKVQAFGF